MTPPLPMIESTAARRYAILAGVLAGGLIALVAACNFFVDPNAYFGRNRLGFYTSAGLPFKVLGLQRHPDDAVLLGDSKAAFTDTSRIQGSYPFYNAGVCGAAAEDILDLLRRVPPQAPYVVVALDYWQYSTVYDVGANTTPPFSLHEALANLFSWKILGYSLKTLASVERHWPPTYLADGNFVSAPWYEQYDRIDPVMHADVVAKHDELLRHFQFSPMRLQLLEPLRDTLRARGRPFAVYIVPLNREEMDELRRTGHLAEFTAWRARVKQVFPDVVDLTDSSYADPKNFFRQDLMHFYPNVGADMLREVLAKKNK